MSQKKKLIIAAAAIAGLIALVVTILLNKNKLAGTPIIIKGSSDVNQYLVLEGVPSAPGNTHTATGEIENLKILDGSGCIFYKYPGPALPDLHLTTKPSIQEVKVEDRAGDKLDITFENGRFKYSADDKTFTSLEYQQLERVRVGVGVFFPPECTKKNGEPTNCEKEFPNGQVSLKNLEIRVNYGEQCK